LILKTGKIRNIHFVGNLTLSTSEFYYDDVTTTSFINMKSGDVATEIAP